MFELSSGELFLVVFVTVAVVSATWWPRLGAAIAEALTGKGSSGSDPDDKAK